MKHADLDRAEGTRPTGGPTGRAALAGAVSALGAALWALNVQHVAAPSEWLRFVAIALLVAYVALTARRAPRMTRIIATVCLALTAALLATGAPASALREGLDFALIFMGFFPALGLVRAAFEAGPRLERIAAKLGRRSAAERSDSLLMLAHVAGAVMTLGAVGVVGPVAQAAESEAAREAAALTCLRGMCLAVLWTPFTVGMGFAASHLPGVPLWQAALCGGLLACVGLAASLRGGRSPARMRATLASVSPILAPVLAAASGLILLNGLTGLSTLHLIILLAPPASVFYVWRAQPAALPALGARTWRDLGGMGGDMLLFASSITMGFALQAHPGFDAALAHLGLGGLPMVAIMGLMTAMAILCALAGLHVTVTGAITIAVAAGLDGALSDLAVFLLILFAWSMGAMLSMASLAVAVTGRTFGLPMTRLIYSANLRFAAALGLGLTLVAGLVDWAFGA